MNVSFSKNDSVDGQSKTTVGNRVQVVGITPRTWRAHTGYSVERWLPGRQRSRFRLESGSHRPGGDENPAPCTEDRQEGCDEERSVDSANQNWQPIGCRGPRDQWSTP